MRTNQPDALAACADAESVRMCGAPITVKLLALPKRSSERHVPLHAKAVQ